ncbi:OLFM4 protein, partial [Polypterus senegalus]
MILAVVAEISVGLPDRGLIQEYSSKIILYEDQLANLTVQVENLEISGMSFNELEFELVKNEIKEMEVLITQLKDSLNGSNIIIDNLFLEIQNLSAAVGELETLDKNNVLVIRREVSALRKQLKECEEAKNQTSSPIIPGSCNHGTLLNMSEPFIVQLNWKGFSYKGGAWGKDPEPATSNRELYWQVPLTNDFRYMQQYRYYNSYDDLRLYRNPHDGWTSYYGQGSGMVVYKEKLYYNCQDSNQICRVSVNTGNFEMRKSLPNATFNNMFSYAGTPWQDIDIAVDESGLWAIYATEESTGNIVISKLNETTLDVEDTWVTRMYRRAVSNAFITSVSNTSGTLDANGVCRCAVYLPDEPFPVDRFEKLEILSVSLSSSVQQEISKIQQYTSKMYAYEQRLQNLTARVQTIERGDISFTELDFELLRIEIAQMESLVTQLKTSVSDSNGIISQLYTEFAGSGNGTRDENGACQCLVYLPDPTFPVTRVEQLEIQAVSLLASVEREIAKIGVYTNKISVYEKRMQNLTLRVDRLEKGEITYTELDFELLRIEIKEMESLVSQLKASFSDSNFLVDQLYLEVIPLESSCNHGPISNLSQPFVVQLNWRGFGFKAGAWGKDPEPVPSKKELYWQAPLNTDNRYMEYYRYYSSYDDFLLYKNPAEKRITYGQGSGMVVYKNYLYYNCHSSRDVCKLDIETNSLVVRKTIPNAAYDNRFSYSTPWQDIDVVVDESGLWVIYATEESTGNIVIGKLNETTLNIEKTWVTKQYKPSVSGAFLVCGVLYATRTVNTRQEEVFYMYDTKTEQEGRVSVVYSKMMEYIYGVNYNPKDHKLYAYNDGYLVTYDLSFSAAGQAPKPA